MATIITVHGTGATGPERGERWWQKGSPVEAQIREFVESEDGRLDYEPLIWDGANSENSRRAAGRRLAERFSEHERRGEKYCAIGHSHGGSVITAALFLAAIRRRKLPHLGSWITIGTPFLVAKKRRFLFNRINFWEKSAYVLVITSGLLITIGMFMLPNVWQMFFSNFRIEYAHLYLVMYLLAFLILFSPAILVVGILSLFSSRRCYSGRKRCARRFDQYFVERWLSFYHKDDEAIGGLHLTTKVGFPIFRPLFLLPQLSLLALVMLPAVLLFVIMSESAALWLFNFLSSQSAILPGVVENGQLQGQGKNIAVNAMLVASVPMAMANKLGLTWVTDSFQSLGMYLGATLHPNLAVLITALLFFLYYAFMFFVPALLIVLAVTGIGAFASIGLSRVLDGLTWRQLKASAFGDDHLAEAVVGTGVRPMWVRGGKSFLPEELDREITAFSDQKAARSVARLRSAVHVLAFAEGGRDKSDLLSSYLTWEELIHTSYFQVPRFCKLVAYALSTTDGFRATAAFRADPDYTLVARWFDETQRANEIRAPDAAAAPVPQSGGFTPVPATG